MFYPLLSIFPLGHMRQKAENLIISKTETCFGICLLCSPYFIIHYGKKIIFLILNFIRDRFSGGEVRLIHQRHMPHGWTRLCKLCIFLLILLFQEVMLIYISTIFSLQCIQTNSHHLTKVYLFIFCDFQQYQSCSC